MGRWVWVRLKWVGTAAWIQANEYSIIKHVFCLLKLLGSLKVSIGSLRVSIGIFFSKKKKKRYRKLFKGNTIKLPILTLNVLLGSLLGPLSQSHPNSPIWHPSLSRKTQNTDFWIFESQGIGCWLPLIYLALVWDRIQVGYSKGVK